MLKRLGIFALALALLLPILTPATSQAPFLASGGASLSVTGSTGRVALPSGGSTALLTNTGIVTVYVKFGDVTVTAATTDIPIPAGFAISFDRAQNTYVAAITGSGTATLLVATGTGIPYPSTGNIPLLAGTATVGTVGQLPYPVGAVPYTATATGTTGATTATLAGAASVTTYICGFSIRANATAAATGNATVTGVITATLNFTQWTAPLASGLGVNEQLFSPCIPASAVNTSIAVVSAAPGSGGVVSVTAWGYKL